jgi:hypothetical protein
VNQVPLGRDAANPPTAGSFSQINFANTTLAAYGDGLMFTGVGDGSGGNNYTGAVVAIPGSGAYSLTVGFDLLVHNTDAFGVGLCVTDGTGASAKLHDFMLYRASGAYHLYVQNATFPGTFSSTPLLPTAPLKLPNRFWMRINDDRTTNLTFSISPDGVNWPDGISYNVGTVGRTSWLTPAYIGLFRFRGGSLTSGKVATQIRVFDWILA